MYCSVKYASVERRPDGSGDIFRWNRVSWRAQRLFHDATRGNDTQPLSLKLCFFYTLALHSLWLVCWSATDKTRDIAIIEFPLFVLSAGKGATATQEDEVDDVRQRRRFSSWRYVRKNNDLRPQSVPKTHKSGRRCPGRRSRTLMVVQRCWKLDKTTGIKAWRRNNRIK